MLAELYVLSGRDAGKVLEAVAGPTLFLGRAATNQLRIRDPQASRVHCRIDVGADGLTINDVGSGNGTYLNGGRLGETPQALQDGDEVRIGATRMRILVETEADRARWRSPSSASGSGGDVWDESAAGNASAVDRVELANGPGGEGRDGSRIERIPGGGEVPLARGAGARPEGGAPRETRRTRAGLREVIPGFRLETRLGGHSRRGVAIYRAFQHALARHVALKVLLPRGPLRREDVQRFVREARALASLSHPNVVTIHDLIARGKMRVIVIEYLAGGSLADRLADQVEPPGLEEVLRVGVAVARALAHLHAHGVVHRQVQPGAILLAPEHGTYKLGGFGRVVEPREASPGEGEASEPTDGGGSFVAPEQRAGRGGVDPRWDVYGLGATLYAASTGRPPGAAASDREAGAALDPRVPAPLQALLARCLASAPERRFADGTELLAALLEVSADVSAATTPGHEGD